MKSIRFLLRNLDAYRFLFAVLLVAGGIDGIASFMVPILLSQFLKGEISLEAVKYILPVIAGCLLTTLIMQWCLRKWGESLSIWITNSLRLKLFRRAETLRAEVLMDNHSGYLLSLIGQVAGSVGGLSSLLVWLVGHVVTTMSLFFYFTGRESLLMAAINGIILILFLFVSLSLSRRIVPFADRRNMTQARLNERFFDFLANILTVRKLGIIEPVLKRLGQESALSDRANFNFQVFHANRWFILHAIFFTSVYSTIAFLLYQIELGQASASIVILFIAGFSRVQNHAERISELIKSLIESDVYVDQLETILSQSRPFGARPLELPFRKLRISQAVHRYGDNLHQIEIPEFELSAGERVLISGQSGQGKSTLLSIIAGQLNPLEGTCLWNERDYSEFDGSFGGAFALVSQETELFNLSIRENLTMSGAVADGEIIELLDELGLTDFLRTLPAGLDTVTGEKGLRLSAGQKQRINLARALLLDRPLLLLDEPTSHLDVFTEELVMQRLSRLAPEVSMVIVSHRPVLKKLCGREYRFQQGRLLLPSEHA